MNEYLRICFNPTDILFFGKGVPFFSGENHSTESIPSPSDETIIGAIRAIYYNQNPKELKELLEGNQNPCDVDYHGTYIESRDHHLIKYFSCPEDLHILKKHDDEYYGCLPSYYFKRLKNNDFELWPSSNIDQKKYDNQQFFVSDYEMKKYINGEIEIEVVPISSFIDSEPHTGHRSNYKGVAKDGFLYRQIFLRLRENYIFCTYIKDIGLNLSDPSEIAALGGEGRYCHIEYNPINATPVDFVRLPYTKISPFTFIKIYFPTILSLSKKELTSIFNATSLQLKSIATTRPHLSGGWDLKSQSSKLSTNLYNKGTVLVLQYMGEETSLSEITTKLKGSYLPPFIITNKGINIKKLAISELDRSTNITQKPEAISEVYALSLLKKYKIIALNAGTTTKDFLAKTKIKYEESKKIDDYNSIDHLLIETKTLREKDTKKGGRVNIFKVIKNFLLSSSNGSPKGNRKIIFKLIRNTNKHV